MACTIKYNKKGKIETVLTPQGKESQLFKQIAKLPHVNNLEEALDIFKNSYSKRFYNIIGEKGAKNLDQVEEVNFRLDNLEVARSMEQSGKSPEEIKIATGWERGASEFINMQEDDIINTLLQKGTIKEIDC